VVKTSVLNNSKITGAKCEFNSQLTHQNGELFHIYLVWKGDKKTRKLLILQAFGDY